MNTDYLLDGESQSNDDNLEMFNLIWLDSAANNAVNEYIQEKLRSFINHLKKFNNKNACQKYIEQRRKEDRLVIIVSGRFGREIVPDIHDLREILSIYVYCMDKKLNEEWACQFSKVIFY
jgi:hypothetical protein